MLRNIFLKTVRDYRWQILIWGGGIGLLMLVYGPAYNSVFGPGPNRDQIIADYKKTVDSFSILTGKVYDLDTFGGFITTKLGSGMPIILGIWALLAGSMIIRGEEERGSLDLLLSTPHTRMSVFLQKWAGMMVAMAGIVGLSFLGILGGAAAAKVELDPMGALMAHVNWGIGALVIGGFALLIGQLTTRKAAAGWAGGIMAGTYLLNNLVANVESLQWTQYINPYYYASLSQPLARSVGTNWVGIIVQVLLMAALVAIALWMYRQRDHNGYFEVRLFKRSELATTGKVRLVPEPKEFWLKNNFAFGLRIALPGIIIWGLSISAYSLLILSVFNDLKASMVDLLNSVDFFKQLGFLNLTRNENILSLFIFLFTVLLVAAYAVVQVSSWTSEENSGRLELVLSTPRPRWRFLLTNFGVALVSSALMVGLVYVIFGLSTWAFDVPVSFGNTLAAFFGLWIICVIIEAVGFVLAAFGPGWAVGVTAGLVILSYLTNTLGDTLKLPDSVINLSVFKQYGQPLIEGLKWTPQIVMVALSILFIVVAVYRFRQRDITK
jgi:ABC-2 type transport system permease protein